MALSDREFWDRVHEVERLAGQGVRPQFAKRTIVPLARSSAMVDAREMLEELASAGSSPATQLALARVQESIDQLAMAVASDMMGS